MRYQRTATGTVIVVSSMLVLVFAAMLFGLEVVRRGAMSDAGPSVNPDPNHTHADFAVWISGQKIDFSQESYMLSTSEPDAVKEHAPHLHDGNGSVLHRHKPGQTLREFFLALGGDLTKTCFVLEGKKTCNGSGMAWRLFVNGSEQPFDPAYVFEDLDKMLLVYGAPDADVSAELAALSDDACFYSRTCPERGSPPSEDCIADPTVPCVE